MSQRRRQSRRVEEAPADAMTDYTLDQLEALDRQVQLAQDQRFAAHLVVSGAGIPDASGPAPYPGVPEGATFAPVEARFDVAEVLFVSETPHQRVYREAGL